MSTTTDRHRHQMKGVLLRWAQRSVPLQQSLVRMEELIGPVNDRRCLWVVADAALVGYQVMERGGRWDCVTVLEKPGLVTDCLLGDTLTALKAGRLPYEDEAFDVVMMDHVLEYFEDAGAFVTECHRVLKPGGFMVAQTQLAKSWSLIGPLKKLFGLGEEGPGVVRKGFTEGEMFEQLKDGFDTEEVLTWSRFFVEATELNARLFVALAGGGADRLSGQVGDDERMLMGFRKVVRVYSIFYPFAKLSQLLDKLLFLHRGHRMVIRARKRQWKPRVTPTLKDGRSIADAAINTKIGTAAPF